MPAQLLALTEGPSIYLDKPILLFGRDLECDVRFDSRKMSRKHCCIAQVSDYLVIRDLGSTNGIRINGVRVLEGRLRAGDELSIGNFRYQVRWDEQAVAPRRDVRPPAAASRPAPRLPDPTARGGDDDLLEQCDEPVPLEESASAANLPEAKPVDMDPVPAEPDTSGQQPVSPPSPPGHSPMLPKHLLSSASDSSFPGAHKGSAI